MKQKNLFREKKEMIQGWTEEIRQNMAEDIQTVSLSVWQLKTIKESIQKYVIYKIWQS